MTPLEVILERLQNVTQTPQGYAACCPGHLDEGQALELRVAPTGGVLLQCAQGCPVVDILAAIDLTTADLMPIPKAAPVRTGNVVALVKPDPYAKEWALTAAPAIPIRPFVKVLSADVEAVPVNWLWRDWIAAGKMTLLGGNGGSGKTTVAMEIAAIVSTGREWPDGTRPELPGDVWIWSAEDDRRDTLKPRLLAAKHNPERVTFLGDTGAPFDPARDLPLLRADIIAAERAPALIVLDPIICAIDGNMNMANDVRRALQPWVDLAEEFGIALLGIHHLTKGGGTTLGANQADRFTGSGAFNQLARMAIICDKNEHGTLCVMARAKSNISTTQGGFSYQVMAADVETLDHTIRAMCIKWVDSVEGSAREIIDIVKPANEDEGADKQTRQKEAEELIISMLANGPKRGKEVLDAGAAAGHAQATMYRAKEKLGVESVRGYWRFGEELTPRAK